MSNLIEDMDVEPESNLTRRHEDPRRRIKTSANLKPGDQPEGNWASPGPGRN